MVYSGYGQIRKKLEDLNITSYKNKFEEYSEKDILQIENRYGFRFPEDYKWFLLEYGKSYFNTDGIFFSSIEKGPLTSQGGLATIGGFYGLGKSHDSIEENIDCYIGRMPKSLVPIADDGCSNQICIGVSGDFLGENYFWHHENEMEAKEMLGYIDNKSVQIDKYNANLYLIAHSFMDFIMSFFVRKEEKTEVDLNNIKIWLSDDLL